MTKRAEVCVRDLKFVCRMSLGKSKGVSIVEFPRHIKRIK